MAVPTTARSGDVYDATPDFVYAVSLLAALEDATGQDEHSTVLPFLGMARAELTDFGQRRPAGYVPVQVGDLRSGLADLEQRLTALLAHRRCSSTASASTPRAGCYVAGSPRSPAPDWKAMKRLVCIEMPRHSVLGSNETTSRC